MIVTPPTMILCHYLTPNNIVVLKQPKSKESLLRELALDLVKVNKLDGVGDIATSIVEREAQGSTFIPTGIAIPHTRTAGVSEIQLMLGAIPEGFQETPESEITYLVFLFVSPTQEKEFGNHLKFLAKISSIFNDPTFVKDVAKIADPDKIFAMIQQKERAENSNV